MTEPPDYTNDWKSYWATKYSGRDYRSLKSSAEEPIYCSLTALVDELNPDSNEYDFAIDTEHLHKYPDQVLNDARRGFADFVTEEGIDAAKGSDYDLLFIHVDSSRRNQFGYLGFAERSVDSLLKRSNMLVTFQGAIGETTTKERTSRTTGYRCPVGHTTRINQPIYTDETIDICDRSGCTNSAIQVSDGTTTIPVVNFEVTIDEYSIDCVTAGAYTEGRKYDLLSQAKGSVQVTGILRNVETQNDGVAPLFEVLSINYAER